MINIKHWSYKIRLHKEWLTALNVYATFNFTSHCSLLTSSVVGVFLTKVCIIVTFKIYSSLSSYKLIYITCSGYIHLFTTFPHFVFFVPNTYTVSPRFIICIDILIRYYYNVRNCLLIQFTNIYISLHRITSY